jgi:tellurite resistance protein
MALPTAFFGMILGLVGLGSGWRIAATIWSYPAVDR